MPAPEQYTQGSAAGSISGPARMSVREWMWRQWRPAGTVVAVGLALVIGWHVVKGQHGLSVWEQKRAEDRQLQKEIDDLQRENAHLRDHVERLKTDPSAIETEARKQLHYTRPGEVVYVDPAPPRQPLPPPVAQPNKPGIIVSIVGVAHDAYEAVRHMFGGGSH
jgi:cell division protein FtsB